MTSATIGSAFVRHTRALVIAMIAAGAALVVGAFVFAMPLGSNKDLGIIIPGSMLVPAFVIPGSMIARKQPGNALGWVLATVGLLFGVLIFNPDPAGASAGVGLWVRIATAGMWAPPIFTLLSVLPLIFPDGRLPSKRWRIAIWAGMVGSLITVVLSPFDPEAGLPARNPIANEVLYGISNLGPVVGLSASVAAMVGMVRRFRRARGTEREQMKLLVSAVVIAVILMVSNGALIGLLGPDVPTWIEAGFLLSAAAILAIGVAYAILRHRLFDINLVISKALVFGVLGVVVTGLYVAFVVGIGALAGRGNEPNLGLSIAATAVAALVFQPLRARAQHLANRIVYGKRATPYEILSHLSEQLRETYAGEDVLVHMAQSMAQGTGARQSHVWMKNENVLWTAASWPIDLPRKEIPLAGSEIPALQGVSFTVPVEHAGELLGALSITKPPNDPLTTTEERLMTDLGSQAGLVLRNTRLTSELLARLEELKASRQRLVKAQDEERRRLERNLHDGAQQLLVALKVKLGLAARLIQDDELRTMIEQVQTETGEAIDAVRDLARGIYPPLLASDGLVAALTSQANKATLPVELEADGLGRYPQELEAAVYFCVLEALQNVQKYAQASRALVRLSQEDGTLRFEVTDDGRGFDPATVARGSGTQNMADRLGALDGSVEIRSEPGAGTTVIGSVPVPMADPR